MKLFEQRKGEKSPVVHLGPGVNAILINLFQSEAYRNAVRTCLDSTSHTVGLARFWAFSCFKASAFFYQFLKAKPFLRLFQRGNPDSHGGCPSFAWNPFPSRVQWQGNLFSLLPDSLLINTSSLFLSKVSWNHRVWLPVQMCCCFSVSHWINQMIHAAMCQLWNIPTRSHEEYMPAGISVHWACSAGGCIWLLPPMQAIVVSISGR